MSRSFSSSPQNGIQTEPNYGIRLNPDKAVEIYKEKLAKSVPKTFQSSLQGLNARIRGESVPLAIKYMVSPKTIRYVLR